MALRQLMLAKKLEQRKAELDALLALDEGFKTRSAALETSIEEAQTDDELATVDEAMTQFESEKEVHEEQKNTLSAAITEIEEEISSLSAKDPVNKTEKRSDPPVKEKYYGTMSRADIAYLGRMDTRMQVAEDLKRDDVNAFYTTIRDGVMKTRALSDTELLIPNTVLDRIQIIVGDYGKLYSEVDVIRLNGTGRVVLDGANPEAIWVEMCDPLQEIGSSFSAVEVDGYKVGGYVPVCNAILEDSMINLAMYVERKLGIAIAKALDKAILLGTGSAGKQPMGIIPNLAGGNVVTLADDTVGGIFGSLFENMSLIDTGENNVGEVIAVMKRATYYARVAPRLVIVNSAGTYTLPNIQNPNFAGLRVVFSQYMPDGQVLVGDYKKYLLSERAGVQLASSKDVKFIEDQTVFKGTARYDGKPVNLDSSGTTHDWILAAVPETANP